MKITECGCALSEAIHVSVYMRKNSLTKPRHQVAQAGAQIQFFFGGVCVRGTEFS